MKVLFINPAVSIASRIPSCPLGLLSVASYAKSKGHIVKIADLTVKKESIVKLIKSFDPDVVAITVISSKASKSVVNVSKIAKKYNKTVVWGGHEISLLPELGFKENCVDFIVIGEGEITFCELLDTIKNGGSYYDVDGLAFTDKDEVHINKYREFADLSTFPVSDWSLVEPKRYLQPFFNCKKMVYIYASKGCPAKCTFCYNAKYHHSKHRTRPPEHFINEIEYLIKNYGVDGIYFSDEFWCPNKEDRQRFFSLVKEKKLEFVWGCMTRIGAFNKEDLQQMYDSGCRWILFGIESGCKERIKLIKKGIDLDKAKETMENCKEIGITSQSSLVLGYPDETVEELKETVDFAFYLGANLCTLTILFLDPGSEIFEYAVANGLYRQPRSLKEWGDFDLPNDVTVNLTKVPDIDLLVIHYRMQWLEFWMKDSVKNDSFGIVKKMVGDMMKRMIKYGPINFFPAVYFSLKQFITVCWYANLYPKVLKKYGMYKRKYPDDPKTFKI